jgi:hypothetical protein
VRVDDEDVTEIDEALRHITDLLRSHNLPPDHREFLLASINDLLDARLELT